MTGWTSSFLTLVTAAHSNDDSSVGIHNTFTESNNVLQHLVVGLRVNGDTGSLLENTHNNVEVLLEVAADCLSNISEALENGGLELLTESVALQVVQEVVHEVVAERSNVLADATGNVTGQSDGHVAELLLLLVGESSVDEGDESLHVLGEVLLEGVRKSTNSSEDSVGDGGVGRKVVQDVEKDLHDTVRLGLDLLVETEGNGSHDNCQTGLHLLQSVAVVSADDLGTELNGLLETLQDDVAQLGNRGHLVISNVGDERAQHLIRSGTKLVVGIGTSQND